MDLLDRYLNAVSVFLPLKNRSDITAELRDVLMTRREEKEEKLGRPLLPGEDADVFREFGHPILVAARYGPHQTLIGPDVYPLYSLAVKALLAILAVSALITAFVRIGLEGVAPDLGFARLFNQLWTGGISIVGALTIIAWLFERYHIRLSFLERWDPNDLPSTPRAKPPTVLDSVGALVGGGVFVLWWSGWLNFGIPIITTEQGEHLQFLFGPVWQDVYWPVLVLVLGRMAGHTVRLVQGSRWTRLSLSVDIVLRGAGLATLAWVFTHGPWLVLGPAGDRPAELVAAMPSVNLGLQIAFGIAMAATAGAIAINAWRLWRFGRGAQS